MKTIISIISKIFGISKENAMIAFVAMVISTLGGTVYGLYNLDGDAKNISNTGSLIIDETFNLVEEIHKLAEFTTVTFYQEEVVYKKKKNDELVLIVRGKVRAGFDLSTLSNEDLIVDSETIKLQLPPVKIFDVITNPSDYETFEESGKWSFEEITDYRQEARDIIEKNALKIGILELAETTAIEKLSVMFQTLGFKEVVIELKYPCSTIPPIENINLW